jgi:hypothetical protein
MDDELTEHEAKFLAEMRKGYPDVKTVNRLKTIPIKDIRMCLVFCETQDASKKITVGRRQSLKHIYKMAGITVTSAGALKYDF